MRSNNRKHTIKVRVAQETPLHDKFTNAFETNAEVTYKDFRYKVVDVSRIAGTLSDEFFLRLIY